MRGFTALELLIAMAMTLAVTAAALALAHPAHAAFRVQLEAVDVTQRLRAAVDVLTRDILMAGSGLPPGEAGVALYETGSADSGLTIRYVPEAGAAAVARSYYVRIDADANLSELRRSEGTTDLPVVDHVAAAAFTCFDAAAALVPSCGDASRIRRVRITLRVEGVLRHTRRTDTAFRVPEETVIVDVAPRALQAGG